MSYNFGIYGPLNTRSLRAYERLGIDAVFVDIAKVSPRVREATKQAKDRGIKVYACRWTFKAPSKSTLFGIKNAHGQRMLWSNAGCPNNPALRERNLTWVEDVLSNLELDGIVLDGVRFPSPGSGRSAFLSCFCEHCVEKANTLGLDLTKIREYLSGSESFVDDVVNLLITEEKPSAYSGSEELQDWTLFRCGSIAEHIDSVLMKVRDVDPTAEVGAATFAPILAPLVGQDYRWLCGVLDLIQPMLYERGDGIACINYELARFVEDFFPESQHQWNLKRIYERLGYEGLSLPTSVEELKGRGLAPEVVSLEMERTGRMTRYGKARLTPILFVLRVKGEKIRQLTNRLSVYNPDGIVHFAYSEGITESIFKAARKGD